ncbi:MAG: serine/threonine protein kinase [Puniceicoccaceae bacterium MED-G30]|jgi:serine/threonine protein kinase|nr:MAG: serine/threonine protein kinase [Puniceicoccaceae bacterium MED-G30]|tara:strand:+ start:250 stop:1245 length:996 start_codon:yes stop_codon:yes gene_type:complete
MAHMKHIFGDIHFEIVRTIAEGGMGIVYEARQNGAGGFKKRIAVKLIREEYSKIDEFRNNFIGEAKLVADLIHTNIVQTYHLGEISGQYYMTMEYVDGITLEDFIERHLETGQSIPCDLAIFIVSRVCRGLSYAHQKCDDLGRPLGIVHRDVNPRNIMLAHEGDVKLTDFGIAKALDLMYNKEGDVIAGKDEYLSPEQARREVTDARADLFCCAIVLSELLLGRNIFSEETAEATQKNILEMKIPDFCKLRPDIDSRLKDILDLSFQRSRDDRYQTAFEMLTALEKFIYGEGYGPTNEKLANYTQDLFGEDGSNAVDRWENGHTPGLESAS